MSATPSADAAADASHHLPWFITPPGETDGLLVAMFVFVILIVLGVGNLYLKLHAIPEHMSHGAQKGKMEVVAVLSLIALFTHQNIFWIAALLLAMVDLPNVTTPLQSIAASLEKLTRGRGPWRQEPELIAGPTPEAFDSVPALEAGHPAPSESAKTSTS